jgi:hypothetical protein
MHFNLFVALVRMSIYDDTGDEMLWAKCKKNENDLPIRIRAVPGRGTGTVEPTGHNTITEKRDRRILRTFSFSPM